MLIWRCLNEGPFNENMLLQQLHYEKKKKLKFKIFKLKISKFNTLYKILVRFVTEWDGIRFKIKILLMHTHTHTNNKRKKKEEKACYQRYKNAVVYIFNSVLQFIENQFGRKMICYWQDRRRSDSETFVGSLLVT